MKVPSSLRTLLRLSYIAVAVPVTAIIVTAIGIIKNHTGIIEPCSKD